MKRIVSIVTIICFIVPMIGCVTTGQEGQQSAGQSAAAGAIIGAIGGALVGATTGGGKGALKGALIGAAVGGITGFIVGKYREKQYKTVNQVYKENPYYAKEDAKDQPPVVENLQPYILDSRGRNVNSVKNGEKVELAMKYDVVIPKYNDAKQINVEECNTLVNANGEEMDRSKLTRAKIRQVGGTDAGIEVTIPKNLSDGKYTHVAIVKLGDKEYKKEQQILVAKSNGEMKIYALNKNH